MLDISSMTTAELLAAYNKMATTPVKRFATRAAGIARLEKLIAEQTTAEPIATETAITEPLPGPAAAPQETARERVARLTQMLAEAKTAVRAEAASGLCIRSAMKTADGSLGLTGKKLVLFELLSRPDGVSDKEGSAALGWAACAATIGKILHQAEASGMTVRRWKGEDNRTRYAIGAA